MTFSEFYQWLLQTSSEGNRRGSLRPVQSRFGIEIVLAWDHGDVDSANSIPCPHSVRGPSAMYEPPPLSSRKSGRSSGGSMRLGRGQPERLLELFTIAS
jgi:hypothetical protein